MNNFYLYKGLIKFYENKKKNHLSGIKKLNDEELEQTLDYIKILTTNFHGNETALMKTFNCNPEWPICLYDFTYKNKSNEYQSMRLKNRLSHYVVDNYFFEEQ